MKMNIITNKNKQVMRKLIMNPRIILPVILLMLLSGYQTTAQVLPVVTARFANPYFDCETQLYCVDVELISDTPDKQLYGMNVRFFYDGTILEYYSTGDFEPGYDILGPPAIQTLFAGSGAYFGLNDPLIWYNGAVQLTGSSSLFISTTEWTRYFTVCFKVINPIYLGIDRFCPPLVWDLEEDPANGGYLPGDDGVVITLVGEFQSTPTTENVDQFNWYYTSGGNGFGLPEEMDCVDTTCGYTIPVANWAILLAIGLMIMATLFIYRRRA